MVGDRGQNISLSLVILEGLFQNLKVFKYYLERNFRTSDKIPLCIFVAPALVWMTQDL